MAAPSGGPGSAKMGGGGGGRWAGGGGRGGGRWAGGYGYGRHGHFRHRGRGFAYGFAYGAAPYIPYGYYDNDYYEDEPVYEVAPQSGADEYCAQRYRSYDPASGTYLGYDGVRHPCP